MSDLFENFIYSDTLQNGEFPKYRQIPTIDLRQLEAKKKELHEKTTKETIQKNAAIVKEGN